MMALVGELPCAHLPKCQSIEIMRYCWPKYHYPKYRSGELPKITIADYTSHPKQL